MAVPRSLVVGLAALASVALAEESCAGDDVEEMVALQVHDKASTSALAVLPPPCGYVAFLESSCAVSNEFHDSLVQAKAACSKSGWCGGVYDDASDSKFWLCKQSMPIPGKAGTVFARAGHEECAEAEEALLQQPILIPTGQALAQLKKTSPPPPPPPPGFDMKSPAACFSPDESRKFGTLNDAMDACRPDPNCPGIYDSRSVTRGYWSSRPGFYFCKAPNNNFGCGSWVVVGIEGVTWWKPNNPNNNECQR